MKKKHIIILIIWLLIAISALYLLFKWNGNQIENKDINNKGNNIEEIEEKKYQSSYTEEETKAIIEEMKKLEAKNKPYIPNK